LEGLLKKAAKSMTMYISTKGPATPRDERGIRAQSIPVMDKQRINTFRIDRILSAIMPQKGVAVIAITKLAAFMKPTWSAVKPRCWRKTLR
jgi:hypothetical protein